MDVAKSDGKGNVNIWHCDSRLDQSWTHYENGEIVNNLSNWCLDVAKSDGKGNVAMWYCDGGSDQRWKKQDFNGVDNHWPFENLKSHLCLDVAKGDAKAGRGVGMYRCDS